MAVAAPRPGVLADGQAVDKPQAIINLWGGATHLAFLEVGGLSAVMSNNVKREFMLELLETK
jgi:hypothetical protein